VPEAETLPLESMLKRPSMLALDVATLKELAVKVEVVTPSVTWKMLGPASLPMKLPVLRSVPQVKRPVAEL